MKTFKQWASNSDNILLFIITVIFWIILIAGIIKTDIVKSLKLALMDDVFGFAGALLGCLIVVVMSLVLPVYLIRNWIKFKRENA